MQIIQAIRDKGAAIVISVIALSLIGFILMDAKQGSNNMSSSRSSSIGKVNGSSIDLEEFNKRVNQQELQQKQQYQRELTTSQINDIRTQVWNLMVDEKVFYAEADKLGIDFTGKELTAILSANDPNNPVLKEITDENTGQIDQAKLMQVLSTIKKAKGEQSNMIDAQVTNPQRLTSISTKYYAMLSASAYYPSWMEESDKKESKTFANISYVGIPYNVISDSTVKVSDEEIEKYVQEHKDKFKQEAGRMISYVSFSQLPSAADSARTKELVNGLKDEFGKPETNVKSFVAKNSSNIPFDSSYKPKAQLRTAFADSIIKAPVGTVYGPFVEQSNYVLARVLGTKSFPDSVKARHILIPTVDPQSGQPIMEDSVAHKKADSIFAAIKAGADFAAMAKQFSSDPGSKDKGGEYPSITYGQMVPEFNDFVFTKPVGSRDVVKTQFGYHIIEIMSQKGSSLAYKIAFIAKDIIPSEATINSASLEAIKASAEKDSKKLDAYLQKNGLKKIDVPELVKENDYNIGQLQDARQVVNWIFSANAGDVSEPFSLGDQFVVAIVNKIYKKGTQDVQTARPLAEGAIREQKKAAEIIKKLGANPTLESAAAAYGKQVLIAGADSSLTFKSVVVKEIGEEPKLVGASFNKDFQTKVSPPIAGTTGVYLVKVNSLGTKAADTPEAAAAIHTERLNTLRTQATVKWYDGLKDKADIKDNRSKSF
jgi:peptidyl-prolyl cis-trans isomerase D